MTTRSYDYYLFKLNRSRVPFHLRAALAMYLGEGFNPGSFLVHVLENDLRGACLEGDEESLAGLVETVSWLCHHAPAIAWGTPGITQIWGTRIKTRPRLEVVR